MLLSSFTAPSVRVTGCILVGVFISVMFEFSCSIKINFGLLQHKILKKSLNYPMINDYTILVIVFVLITIVIFGMWFLHYQLSQKLDQISNSFHISRKQDLNQDVLQRKLHAYERLSLLLERLQYPNVIKRVYEQDLNAKELINRMKMDIQAEYDHNITQQIYVSAKLWEIIHLTKEDSLSTLSDLSLDIESYQSEQVVIQALIDKLGHKKFNPIDKALLAIRTEVNSLF